MLVLARTDSEPIRFAEPASRPTRAALCHREIEQDTPAASMNGVERANEVPPRNHDEVYTPACKAVPYEHPEVSGRRHELLAVEAPPTARSQRLLELRPHVRNKEVLRELDVQRQGLSVGGI